MGRWNGKTEADDLKKIDIRWLKKEGYLGTWTSRTITWTNGWTGNKSSVDISISLNGMHVSLSYTRETSSGKKNFLYSVPLERTLCFFGGYRYWFICPLSVNGILCRRRVGVLYLASDYFGCRHCHNLTYASKNEKRNSFCYPFIQVLKLEEKIEKLMNAMKRWRYAGKPTKRLESLRKLQRKSLRFSSSVLDKKEV